MKDCIFCKIVKGDIPATKIYENELVFCFLDIAPINLGHTLVIPKEHHTSITTIPAEIMSEMALLCQQVGRALQRLPEYDGFNIHLNNGQCAGQDVMHSHFHIIPRVGTDQFFWNWRQLSYDSEEQKNEMASNIVKKLTL